jgi:GNAT superfamily N-acetyltransferase
MGVAELSPMLFCATYFNPNPDPEGHWLYFNRLFVPPRLRRKGVGTELMTTVCGLADERHVHILNEINPYGDMTFEQLLTFFEKFGFIQIGSTHVVYRLHKGS